MRGFRITNAVWTALALLLVGAIGFFDYATGHEVSFGMFYLVPLCLAAWKAGPVAGMLIALVASLTWVFADILAGLDYSSRLIPFWNAVVRFLSFAITVWLIWKTKRLTVSLEDKAGSLTEQIAERRKAEEALAESQRTFRLITENASDLIAVLDPEGRILYCSPSYHQFYRRMGSPEGREAFAKVAPADRKRVGTAFEQTLKTGATQRSEYRVLPASEEGEHYLESEWSLIRESDGAARRVVEVSREVTQRKRMELLYANEKDIVESIAQGKPLPEVLEKLIEKLRAWSDELYCSILVQDAEQRPIWHSASPGLLAATPSGGGGERVASSRPGADAHEAGPVLELDERLWREVEDYRRAALDAGLSSVYARPVLSRLGETLGFLAVFSREADHPQASRLQVFDKIAHVTAIALERQRTDDTLRRLSSLMVNAQELERRRLARELHDGVSQMLASVAFRMESVGPEFPPQAEPAEEQVRKAKFLLKKAILEVRRISENLRPSELDELGLSAALRSLSDDFADRCQLQVVLSLPDETERLSDDLELAIYRIVQEALTNVEKHSEASEATLSLKWDDHLVRLDVSDNGRGLELSRADKTAGERPGMGLVDMRERCGFLGGTFSISSEPGRGTAIQVRIPRDR